MNEKNINIRVVDWEPPQIIHYTQGGTEIPLVFNILDYEIPSGATARIYILKPSKKQVYNSCTVDGNSISYKPTAQSFIEAGRNLVKLQVVVGRDLLFSFTLFVDVEPNFINEDAIESTDEYGALDDLIIQAQQTISSSYSLVSGTLIPADSDLNTYTTVGNYRCTIPANVATIKNCPTAQTFKLYVSNTVLLNGGTYRTQELIDLDGDRWTRYTANNGAAWSNWVKDLNDTDTIPISKGGTGETNRIDAMNSLLTLPNNTVPAEDTPAAWAELGNCTIYYTRTPSGFGFPSTYGTLIQFVNNDSVSTVQQIWLRQAYGMLFNRAGNSTGWNADADLTGEDSWNQVFTTRDLSPLYKAMFADGGSIASNSNLDNVTTPGRYYTPSSTVSASLTNTPFPSNAFEMEVGFEFNGSLTGGTTTVWQRAYVTSTGAEAFRRRYNNAWSDWTYTAVLGSNGALPIADGGTGATTVSGALSNLGLSNAIIMNSMSPSNWNIPANSARGGEIEGNLDGYDGYIPTVVSCYCTNNYSVVILNAWIDGSYKSSGNGFTYHIDARNLSGSTVTADFTIRILWLKENISS